MSTALISDAPRVTREDSADLGFAWACLMSGAVSFDEFRAWAEHIVATTPSEALPAHMIDVMMAETRREVTVGLKELIGFFPADPILESRSASAALFGIAALRGTHRADDAGTSRAGSLDILRRSPDIRDRFMAVFGPVVPQPDWSAP